MSEARPFKVLGVQQVAIGGLDKQKLKRFWVDIMGLTYGHSYSSEKENVDEDICETGAGAFKVEVDLMQPIDPEARPKVHDPALNHVGLWIDDLHTAVEWLESRGVRFTPGGIRTTSPGRISWTEPPQCCTRPTPAVTTRVWPSRWTCQWVRAPGSKTTVAP